LPSDSDSDDDLPQTAQVNNAVACAAATLPQTYAQARKSVHCPEIQVAMLAEVEKLERYKVWRIVKKTGYADSGCQVRSHTKPTGWKARWVKG
jgi:hypothetical protein